MIKRNGVTIKSCVTNTSSAKEVLKVLEEKQYVAPSGNLVSISNSLDNAVQNTILYKDNAPIKYTTTTKPIVPIIEVTDETTTNAAIRLSKTTTNLVALNFASAINPGGGFLMGAIAQEEDLCRASGLYACLKSKPLFYNENVICNHSLYTDNIIYSPDVPFFKDDFSQFLETPYNLSIISAPAPNLRSINVDDKKISSVLKNRISKILSVAANHNHKDIILGAFGCGAFGNDPKMVAEIFLQALQEISYFEHICFAIYDQREGRPVYNTFKNIFIKE